MSGARARSLLVSWNWLNNNPGDLLQRWGEIPIFASETSLIIKTSGMNTFIKISKQDLLTKIEEDINYPESRAMLLKAYNRYQADERDGVDYIFNINNQDDLITCIQGGLTAEGIVNFHNKVRSWVIPTPHFLFGYNHKEMTPMGSDNIVDAIVAVLDELIDNIIAYPWVEEYRAVYTHYISNKIIGD